MRSKAAVHKSLAKGGWGGKWFRKAKNTFKKHAKRHVAKAKTWAKKKLKQGKAMAKEHGKKLLEQAKAEAKQALADTVNESMDALHQHVKSTVCGSIGAGFFKSHRAKLHKLYSSEFNKVHTKAVAHARTGKRGGELQDHVDKAHKRVTDGVERVKNSAKNSIRKIAGCDEGSGLKLRGAGLRLRGAGMKKKCKCK